MTEDNIVSFREAAPSARLKTLDAGDKRARCDHKRVLVWANEPILECQDCGGVVDPYQWIRARCRDWKQMQDALEWKRKELKSEIDDLTKTLKVLRGEFADEAERRSAERALHVWPNKPKRY